jgi:hypothetical protein
MNLLSLPSQPATYHIFSAGRKQINGSTNVISDMVIHDCSGAFDYIDQILQEHPYAKKASIFAIGDQIGAKFQLKPLPEHANINDVRFFAAPIPYTCEEKVVLKKPFPRNSGMKFWEWSFFQIIPEHHRDHAFDLVDSLLQDDYDLIFCRDQFRNTRIVVSTLRGKGRQFRKDLLAALIP